MKVSGHALRNTTTVSLIYIIYIPTIIIYVYTRIYSTQQHEYSQSKHTGT